VFEPFGMQRTSMAGWQPLTENRAHGYFNGPEGPVNAPRYDPLLPFAAGAVLSTSGDLIRYQEGVFGEKTDATVRRQLLRRDRLPDGFELPYTQGCLVISNLAGHRRMGHPGEVFGFEAQYSYYPDDGLTIAVLTNTQSSVIPPASLELKMARVLLGVPVPKILDLPLTVAHAQQFAGNYEVTDMRFGFDRLGFVVRDGALQLVFGGVNSGAPPIALRYQGGNSFISSLDDEERLEFATTAKQPGVTIWLYGSPLSLVRVK
jgi:D-alanyl-D-alanine carboxypeptidase